MSYKLLDNTLVQVVGELGTEKDIFRIDEGSGERVVLENGTYKTDAFKIDVQDGKISVITDRFAEYKLPDGNILKIDGEVSVGNEVMVVTAEGDVPAPDGMYELEDGTKFVVKDGVIESVGEVEPETPEVEPEEPVEMEKDSELVAILKTFINDVAQKLSKLESRFNEYETNMTSIKNDFDSLKNDYNEFKKLPAGNPIKDTKTDFSKDENENNKLALIAKLRNNK